MATIITSAEYGEWASAMGMDASPAALDFHLNSATREIQRICGREFLPVVDARSFVGDESCYLYIDDCVSITSVVTGGGALIAVTDYVAEPRNSSPITCLRRLYYHWDEEFDTVVTGTFGYAASQAAIPDDIKEAACLITASRVMMSAPIAATSNGIKRTTVVNVTVEYDTSNGLPTINQFKAMAGTLLEPYKRLTVPG